MKNANVKGISNEEVSNFHVMQCENVIEWHIMNL